jgi:hypothetical protein
MDDRESRRRQASGDSRRGGGKHGRSRDRSERYGRYGMYWRYGMYGTVGMVGMEGMVNMVVFKVRYFVVGDGLSEYV